jgi:hypothetical protein
VSSDDKAALAVVRGSEVWLLEVSGPKAAKRLKKLASKLVL